MFKTTIVACGTTASAIVATAVAHGQVAGQRRPREKECHAPSLAAAQKSLRASGVAVIDGVMDAPLVAAVRATEAYQGMPLRVERSPGRVGSSLYTFTWNGSRPVRNALREGEQNLYV